jgi:hypothetical protein
MTTNIRPHAPLPAGVNVIRDCVDDGIDSPSRYFEGPDRVVEHRVGRAAEPVHVYIAGLQYVDGPLSREIVVHHLRADDAIRNSAIARQLARAIMAAADDFDRMT